MHLHGFDFGELKLFCPTSSPRSLPGYTPTEWSNGERRTAMDMGDENTSIADDKCWHGIKTTVKKTIILSGHKSVIVNTIKMLGAGRRKEWFCAEKIGLYSYNTS